MNVILVSRYGKTFEFSCKDVNYTVNNGRLSNIAFHNPSVNIPDCFTLSKVRAFEDNGNELTIYCR